MAKVTRTQETVTSIRLSYDLLSLPTAQHKAGLAGLLLQIRSIAARPRDFDGRVVPKIVDMTSTTATIELSEDSTQTLFDDLYCARIGEARSSSRWAGETRPKRIDEEKVSDPQTERTKTQKWFVYDVVKPNSPVLRQHLRDRKGDGPWMKLWREMLWAIPRAQPKAREAYNKVAQQQPCPEVAKVWKELVAFQKEATKNRLRTTTVSGAVFLGAQAVNAEAIPFAERSDYLLLLHFWALTVQVFVPQRIENDGSTDFVGYSMAIPDVADLERFLDEYPAMLGELTAELRGYRPAQAVVDLPSQGALEFMRHMAEVVQHRTHDVRNRVSDAVTGFEYMHLHKVGNNVKCLASGRMAPNAALLEDYLAIIDAKPQPYRNPLFRLGLLTALLNNSSWFGGFAKMLLERPWTLFLRCSETPRTMPFFANDVAAKFRNVRSRYHANLEDPEDMSDTPLETADEPLELLIYQLVRTYIVRKTEERSGLKWNDFKDNTLPSDSGKPRVDVPKEYREAKERIAQDLFLALRSRREVDFVDYFAARICSVGQFLTEAKYQTVARALLDKPEEVKTLALLAVSANS